MQIDRLRPSFAFTEDRLAQLREVVPEAFADDRVNWEALREALGEYLEDDTEQTEHFGLSWPGKRQARRAAATPSHGTLAPCPGEGVNEATTRNIFIEGDNLEVLKLLQKSYAGRVKMIYIDPPYNTGNDFIYVDDYAEPVESYLRRTGQMGEGGELLTTNPRTGGRFHSNWMSQICPRLILARQLLSSEGVIWISIDDGEVATLRALCNEVFGEENFVATFIWEKRTTRENRRIFSFNHDYIVCYAQDKDLFQESRNLLPLTQDALDRYSNPDNDPRGSWQSVALTAQAGHATRSQFYTITTPSGRNIDPPPGSCWRLTKPRLDEMIADNRIWFGEHGNNVPRRKVFLSEAREGLTPHTLWKADEVGTTDSAKKALIDLFDGQAVFDTAKPTELLGRIIQISTGPQDLVMDFFAGSASTAHAMLEINRQDGGCRNYIMVQLPEPTPAGSDAASAGYSTIAEISKERIRRVIAKMQRESASQLDLTQRDTPEDLGFRAFRLTRSHFRRWRDYSGDSIADVQTLFDQFESPLVDGWTPEGLLVEVMLQEGFPLDSNVSRWEGTGANHIQIVASDACLHRLWVCLDARVAEETVAGLAMAAEDVFVCLDSAVTDEQKMRLADRFNVKVI